jgi:hypothetical protein
MDLLSGRTGAELTELQQSQNSEDEDLVPVELWDEWGEPPFCEWTWPSSRTWQLQGGYYPPIIAHVCRESRRVAFRNGGWLKVVSCFYPVWLDPARDVLHLNWSQWVDDEAYPYPTGLLEGVARAQAGRVSITYDLATATTGSVRPYIGEILVRDLLEPRRSYEVCLATVIIHVPETGQHEERRRPIIDSGLFGLFGDKQAQVVSVTDHAKLRQFAIFNEAYGSPQDTRATYFFQHYPAYDVQKHMRQIGLQWLRHRWDVAEERRIFIEHRETVWTPYPESPPPSWYTIDAPWVPTRYTNFDEPNGDHPWVKGVLDAMPEFHPVYIIRLCTSSLCRLECT